MSLKPYTTKLTLGLIASVSAHYIVYYGFITNYTGGIFNLQDFRAQYDSGIFRYRILGKELLILTYRALEYVRPVPYNPENRWGAFLQTDSTNFYHSFFLLNALFLCLTVWAVGKLFDDKELLIIILLISISQFAVNPYDNTGYFLLALSFVYRKTLWAMCVIIVLATLNRETAALSLSLYAASVFLARGGTFRGLLTLTGVFLATYVGLRVVFGWESAVMNEALFAFNAQAAVGVLFALGVGYAVTKEPAPAVVFLILSLPYLLTVLAAGILFEVRLWVPLILGIMLLQTEKSAPIE